MMFEDIPNSSNKKVRFETIHDNLDLYFAKYKSCYEKNKLHSNYKRSRIAREIAIINHNKCKDLLFKILKEKIEYWWD